MMYNTLKYSDKPLMGSVLGYKNAKDCLEMAAIVFGGKEEIKKNPVMAGIPCSLTPLSYDSAQLGAIIAYAEYGQPQLINSLCMAGTTAPATIAGLVSVQNAEVLSGIVLAQCVNPGTPVVYSASGTSTDMSSGSLAIGSSEDALISLINGQLCKYYKEHTLEHYHDEFYRPTLSDRKSFTQWAADGGEPIERAANRRWKEILDSYEEPALPADVDAALKKYMGDI